MQIEAIQTIQAFGRCAEAPPASAGADALRACMPESSYVQDLQNTVTIHSHLNTVIIAIGIVVLALIVTGRLPISSLLRLPAGAARALDKQVTRTKVTQSTNEEEQGEVVTPSQDGEVDSENPKEIDYSQLPYGQRPTWANSNMPDPEEFFAAYNKKPVSEETE